jgi:exopolyphosphatase/guanosine-5'-triphosphate,3'-diphosphate pyrophosphatase
MKKYAVIDIGSNSVRLMFVANGKVLYKRLNTTRLGEGLAQTGRLNAEAIRRSAQAVADYVSIAAQEGAQSTYAFATAAVRSAINGEEFVQAVQALCGLRVEVIAGDTEAEIGMLGALGTGDGAVIDVGGASTELVVKKNGINVYKKSINVGVVRLKDACGLDLAALQTRCNTEVKQFFDAPALKTVYAIGGTATTLAALALGLKEYDSQKITGFALSQNAMQTLVEKLSTKTVAEIAAMPCMPKGRADVITGGAVWLLTIMRALQIESLLVSDRDNLEGYAIKKGLEV